MQMGFVVFGGLFVAHMSGNSAALGAWFGQELWAKGIPHLFAIPIFVFALTLGYLAMLKKRTFRRCSMLLLVEAALLFLFAIFYGIAGPPAFLSLPYFLMATAALLAMGVQNATLRQIGRSGFPSTYVTGILHAFAFSLAGLLSAWKSGNVSPSHWKQPMKAGGMWFSYVVGAIAGSLALVHFGALSVAIPIVAILCIARIFSARPELTGLE